MRLSPQKSDNIYLIIVWGGRGGSVVGSKIAQNVLRLLLENEFDQSKILPRRPKNSQISVVSFQNPIVYFADQHSQRLFDVMLQLLLMLWDGGATCRWVRERVEPSTLQADGHFAQISRKFSTEASHPPVTTNRLGKVPLGRCNPHEQPILMAATRCLGDNGIQLVCLMRCSQAQTKTAIVTITW